MEMLSWTVALLLAASTAGAAGPSTDATASEKAGAFHPQDLAPDFFAESVATFRNPHTNADCIAAEQPNYCCTGFGAGTCDQPVESFRLATCTTRNRDCVSAGNPNACCSGFRTGSCCYEELDTDNGGLGSSYCPVSVCPDGCVSQWVEQSGYKSAVASHPITGRTLEQDDLEKPCYVADCINGHACLEGHGQWTEPGYPVASQPEHDATLEIEPADRVGEFLQCPGTFYVAQLVKVVPQTQDHRLLAGFTKVLKDTNTLQFRPFSGGSLVSVDNVFPNLDAWYFIELQRNPNNSLRLWVDGRDQTRSPAPTNSTFTAWSTQSFCEAKTCDTFDNQEFQGQAALLFYKCGSLPSAQDRASMNAYVLETYTQAVFRNGFEAGNASGWSRALP